MNIADGVSESDAIFRSLFDGAMDSLLLIDAAGHIVEANLTACACLGYEREELLGLSVMEVRAGIGSADIQETWDRVSIDKSLTAEGSYRRKDGTCFPVEENIRAFGYQGRDLLLVCARNISKLRKAEEDLRAELKMWHTTFEAIDDGIFILDGEHRVLRCNEATRRIVGLPVREIIGRSCHDLMHHSDVPIQECPVHRMCESHRRENEVIQLGERWFNVKVEPLTDFVGNLSGVVHIVNDITWQKSREETLRQTNRALQLLSECNTAVVQATEEHTLLEDVCNIAVGTAGYYLAWVGYAEQDDARTVRVVAHAGPSGGLLEHLHISWADNEYGRGSVGPSIRSGKPCIGRDVLNNPDFAPWYEFFSQLNFGSVISVPLRAEGASFGVLGIYAAETNAFDAAEEGLLEELGKNLAHGIMALRVRKERAEAVVGLERARAELEDRVVERTAQLRQEILDRELAEESLRHSEQKYRELVENANSIILRMDVLGRVTFFNEFAQKFFGYEERELLGRSVIGTIVPETETGGRDLVQMIRELASHPERFERSENENVRRNGERVWIAWTNKPVRDQSGRLTGILCIGNDITELKSAEMQLQIFRKFADNAGEAMAMADLDGRITYMNTALLDMLGETEWTPGQDKNFMDCFRMEQRQRLQAEILPVLFTHGDWTGEMDVLTRDGRQIPALVNLFLIRDDAGQPKYIAEIITDMTHQKEAELEILRAKDLAESADRMKSAFLASMSHELRTPLNSIIGFTGILLQGLAGPLNEEQKKQMGMIQKSARHLLQLINDVLDISKIEAGQLTLSIEQYDLCESLKSVLQIIRPMAEKKGLKLTVDIDSAVCNMVSDRRRVEQILINLVNNAIKFTDYGEVRIKSSVDEMRLITSITDTGIGISAQNITTLFETFRQIDTGLTRSYEGTGLGLSICRRLVEMLGGEIWATSEGEQKGSTFTFTLPLSPRTAL
ncbi:MAG: PAS domain S-box protein [Syntrophobacteraceae bacterium]